MSALTIGEVGRKTGLATSAIRYYERSGLLPKPARISGQRRYEIEVLGRLEMIRIAREAGFTIAETKLFLAGFSPDVRPSARWQALATRKLEEIDATIARAKHMKKILAVNFKCGCGTIDDCARGIARKRCG
ncbi:MAG TPA: MerR family transcriptional regulator [Parvularculaceae bacterium]|nr:MerR family transcriptional regulator [Parvularculaceae bacterium]